MAVWELGYVSEGWWAWLMGVDANTNTVLKAVQANNTVIFNFKKQKHRLANATNRIVQASRHKTIALQSTPTQSSTVCHNTYCSACSFRSFGGSRPAYRRGESGGTSTPNLRDSSMETRAAALEDAKKTGKGHVCSACCTPGYTTCL